VKPLIHVGTFLVIVGCFLPWEQGGDFLPYWSYGIRVFPFVDDNGGTIALLLALVIWLLTFRPPKLIENPISWTLAISALLAVSSLFFVIRWLVHRFEVGTAIGSPVIQIGLISVVIGAGFLLFGAIKNYRQAKVAYQ
jgi:CHASE2 domain-containing sensor protein